MTEAVPRAFRVAREVAEEAFGRAAGDDALGRVRDELFALVALLRAQPRLRRALSDISVQADAREALLRDLLASRVGDHTLDLLVSLARRDALAWRLAAILEDLAERAAARRDRVVVEARTAVPLDDERRERLASALAQAVGRQVDLEVTVDPSIVGGVVARMGDEVIDGSVRRKLELARERLTS